MERILVTGGGGFIGSHMARHLYQQGNFVRVADIKFDDYIKGDYCHEKLNLDLREFGDCLIATKDIDNVYNFAANMGGIGFITSVFAEIMHDNVLINTHMLEASVLNKVKRFLFSSSACIYPNFKQTEAEVEGLKEEDAYPADPNEAYGWEKLFTEEMIKAYQIDRGLDARIVRYHNIYGPCYDEKTEVLTKDGFKPFESVGYLDNIATLNKETGYIEYHKPLAIQCYSYSGKLHSIKTQAIDLMVTPDHNLFFTTRRLKSKSHIPYQLETAKNATKRPVLYMNREGKWKGEQDKVWICLPRVKYSDNKRIVHEKHGNKRRVRLTHWLRFLGWYLSEGSSFITPSNHIVDIRQFDETRKAQIVDIVSRMGFNPKVDPEGIRIYSKRLYKAVEPFGKADSKYVPREYLVLPPRRLKQLFECLMAGDGDKDGKRYSTVSQILASNVEEIGIKLGYGVSTSLETSHNGHKPIYRIYFTNETTHRILPKHMSEVEYKGMVYDVTVPNHIILVRRNGKVCWSGNCGTYEGGKEKAPAALCRKVAMASNPGTIEIWGDGKATRSYCYIDDCIKGTIALMESDYDKPLNIGSDRLISVDDLADIIIRISGKQLATTHNLSAPEGVRGRNADLTLVKKVLGWKPRISLEEGLEKAYRWINMMVEKDRR